MLAHVSLMLTAQVGENECVRHFEVLLECTWSQQSRANLVNCDATLIPATDAHISAYAVLSAASFTRVLVAWTQPPAMIATIPTWGYESY